MWSSKRLPSVVVATGLAASALAVQAEVDLSQVQVLPQRGQSADQTRRDRYECHNWAIEQTGVVPAAPITVPDDADLDRAERVSKVIDGALIGASLGGLIRGLNHRNPSHGIVSGAAVGAAVAAVVGKPKSDDESADDATDDYLRALGACLEGRGYGVSVPPEA